MATSPNRPLSRHAATGSQEEGPRAGATQVRHADLLPIIGAIQGFHRERQDFLNTEGSLTRQMKSIQKRMGANEGQSCSDTLGSPALVDAHLLPYMESKALYHSLRLKPERQMEKLAKQLPVWPWVEGVRGVGPLALAQIIGESDDLSLYANPAKLWKRFGLGLVEGRRQRKVANNTELAIAMGYNPRRRAVMWVIGDSLVMLNGEGEYRSYYLSEKERQRDLHPELPDIALHKRAHRHMEKRFLRDLWRVWNGQSGLVTPLANARPDA